MKTQDGTAVTRDVTFLAETQIVPRAVIDRLKPEAGSLAGATLTCTLADPAVPVTMYTEAAAKAEMGRFFVSGEAGWLHELWVTDGIMTFRWM